MLRNLVLLVAAAGTLSAAESMLVSTEWLAGHASDPDLVLLHVGSQKDYDAGHIPGARLITVADISITDARGMRVQLPTAESLAAAFARLGISNTSRIVVYPATGSIQSATRVWFTLDYLGVGDRASLLDGGLALWRSENRAVTKEPFRVSAGAFTPKPRVEAVVDAEWVNAHLKDTSVLLVDARTPEFHTGEHAGGMPRAGRIPGARNVTYLSLLDDSGKFRPAGELRTLLAGGKELVSFCHIGMQATVPYFAARYIGLPVRLYDGSFQDWSSRPELPVEKGRR
jgi:thiosulfate/3-mercaptopyruvate sulfurtransferase